MAAQQLSQIVDLKLGVTGGAVEVAVVQDLPDVANIGPAAFRQPGLFSDSMSPETGRGNFRDSRRGDHSRNHSLPTTGTGQAMRYMIDGG
jgi:hypothetical protein